MKTTLEIPDTVFRRAKSVAAQRGIALREFVTEAVKEKLATAAGSEKRWLQTHGQAQTSAQGEWHLVTFFSRIFRYKLSQLIPIRLRIVVSK